MMETRKVVYENPVIMEIEGYSLSKDKIVYFLNAKSFVDQVASGFELGTKNLQSPALPLGHVVKFGPKWTIILSIS